MKLIGASDADTVQANKNSQSIDLKPQGVSGDMGDGFVSLAVNNDFVKDVGINKVFTFENEKKQYHIDLAQKNKEQNNKLKREYQDQLQKEKDTENKIAIKHVRDQFDHFD